MLRDLLGGFTFATVPDRPQIGAVGQAVRLRYPSPLRADGSGRTRGGDYEIQRGRLNPYHQLFGQVTSRTRRPKDYDQTPPDGLTN